MGNITIRPSNLFRRQHCPGSALAEANVPEKEEKSEVASRGNRIHASIHDGIRNPDNRSKILSECDEIETVEACWKEAEACWNNLTEEQQGMAIVGIENSVDLSAFGMDKGTPDFYIYIPSVLLILRDWKSGEGWVPPARYNSQLGAYACAIIGSDVECSADIGVFQPKIRDYCDSWKTNAIELSDTADKIRRIVEHCQKENSPVVPGGWCQYCRAADSCHSRLAVAAEIMQIANPVSVIAALDPFARALFYERLKASVKMLSDAEESIEETFLAGTLQIPGYEIGEGRKSRYWASEEKALMAMRDAAAISGIPETSFLKPLTVPQAEKVFGKDITSKADVLVSVGKPTIKKSKTMSLPESSNSKPEVQPETLPPPPPAAQETPKPAQAVKKERKQKQTPETITPPTQTTPPPASASGPAVNQQPPTANSAQKPNTPLDALKIKADSIWTIFKTTAAKTPLNQQNYKDCFLSMLSGLLKKTVRGSADLAETEFDSIIDMMQKDPKHCDKFISSFLDSVK